MLSPSPRRITALAAALLLALGAHSHVAAQGSVPIAVPVNDPVNVTILPVFVGPVRNYVGTATQTTTDGQTVTGTFSLAFYKGGGLFATTVFNGVSASYSGVLTQSSTRSSGQRTGSIYFNFPVVDASGQGLNAVATGVPLFVTKTVAYGGIQNEDGTILTFRGTRVAK